MVPWAAVGVAVWLCGCCPGGLVAASVMAAVCRQLLAAAAGCWRHRWVWFLLVAWAGPGVGPSPLGLFRACPGPGGAARWLLGGAAHSGLGLCP